MQRQSYGLLPTLAAWSVFFLFLCVYAVFAVCNLGAELFVDWLDKKLDDVL